jgi:hypothetical protein
MLDTLTQQVHEGLRAFAGAQLQELLEVCAALLAFAEDNGACPSNDHLNAACDRIDALSPLVIDEKSRRFLKGWLASSVPLVIRRERGAAAYQLRQVERALRRALESV